MQQMPDGAAFVLAIYISAEEGLFPLHFGADFSITEEGQSNYRRENYELCRRVTEASRRMERKN